MTAIALIALLISCFAFLSARGAKEEVIRLRGEIERFKQDGISAIVKKPKKSQAAKVAASDQGTITKTEPKKPQEPEKEQVISTPPPPVVPTGPNFMERMFQNFAANWLTWVAALSLAFGGLFIVQYGLERGFLGPVARVLCAIAFGVILLIIAEYLRRKPNMGMQGWFTVPVALAAGGVASLYAGVVAAHVLYDLTSPLVGFASMVAVSAIALLSGVIYGPVLAVVGILGAYVSPLIVTEGESTPLLYLYFLAVLVTSLILERTQRWIWLSALAVAFSFAWGIILQGDMPGEAFYPFYIAAIAIIATSIPAFGLRPKWESTVMLDEKSLAKLSEHYPTVLAVLSSLLTALFLCFVSYHNGILFWQTTVLITVALLLWAIVWNVRAQNLDQYAAMFGITLMLLLGNANSRSDLDLVWSERYSNLSEIGAAFPFTALVVLFTIVLFLFAAFWRVKHSARPIYWLACGTFFPLLLLFSFYYNWSRYEWFGDREWGWLMVLNGAVLGGCAFLMLRRKFDKHILASDLFFLSGFILLFGATLLIVPSDYYEHAFAVLALAALAVLIKYSLKWTGLAIWLNVTGATLIHSGKLLDNGFSKPILEILISTAILAGLFYAGYRQSKNANQPKRLVLFETAGLLVVAITTCFVIARFVPDARGFFDHLDFGLYSTVWGLMAAVQIRRMVVDDGLNKARRVLTWIYSILSLTMFAIAFLGSPLFDGSIRGTFPIDSVVVAYGLPTLVLAGMYYFNLLHTRISNPFTLSLLGASILFIAIHEIRRFWHGIEFSLNRGFHIGELYTYTVFLLVSTIAVVFMALTRKNDSLRKAGLGLAALTAAKVFLWDMNGMAGLPRATAFIVLGLTLAGVGWVLQSARFDGDEAEIDTQK